jgi:hypothetical protein
MGYYDESDERQARERQYDDERKRDDDDDWDEARKAGRCPSGYPRKEIKGHVLIHLYRWLRSL